jgi:hypothetical protein
VTSLFLFNIIVIVLLIVFYLKKREKKSIIYFLLSNSIFEDSVEKIDGLNLQFFKKQIDSFTITELVFWNNGTETLNSKSCLKNSNFSITIADEFEILDYLIKQINSLPINTTLSKDRKIIEVDFECLDKKGGFIIQIYHTGGSKSFNLDGFINNFGKLTRGKTFYDNKFNLRRYNIIQATSCIVTWILIFTSALHIFHIF